jgi:MYXO-CTERM domain-containing protein
MAPPVAIGAAFFFAIAAAVPLSARADSPAQSAAARPAAAPVNITKGPYLQGLTTTAVVVKLELADAADAAVEVTSRGDGGAPAVVAKASSTEARKLHALRVTGLAPATAYEYRVRVGGAPAAEAGRFTTAPADTRPFRFVLYGDNRSDASAHAAVVRAIEKADADFLVHTGDMVLSGAEAGDWAEFFSVEASLLRDRCVFAAIGNHELYGPERVGESAFLRYFGAPPPDVTERPRLYASFRWSNTRFFLLNAMDEWTGAERDWLEKELGAAAAEPGLVHRIAVLHHGPFSSGPHGANPRLESAGVLDLMRRGKVDLVLAGHDHIYERGEGAGLKYVVSGGAGAPLYPRKRTAKETLTFESTHHFVRVAVDGDRVDLVAERPSGSVIERCGFRVGGPWECQASGDAKPASATSGASGAGTGPVPTGAPSAPAPRPAGGCGCAVPAPSGDARGLAALVAVALGLAAARRRRA